MERCRISLNILLLILFLITNINGDNFTIVPPDSPGPGNVTCVVTSASVRIKFNEEVKEVITIAKIIGAKKPRIEFNDGNNEQLGIQLKNENGDDWTILVTKIQDFEYKEQYYFLIYDDSGHSVNVFINIVDINDHDPILNQKDPRCIVPENHPGPTSCTIKVTDRDGICPDREYNVDETDAAVQSFSLIVEDVIGCNVSLTLNVTNELDYESKIIHSLNIRVKDGDRGAYKSLLVEVEDVRDVAPRWTIASPALNIKEEEEFTIVLTATDGDIGVNDPITYELKQEGENIKFFHLDETSGLLTVDPIDRDILDQYIFKITAVAHDLLDQTDCELTIIIEDINDNSPIIKPPAPKPIYEFDEGTIQSFPEFSIIDPDLSDAGTFEVYLEDMQGAAAKFVDAFMVIPDRGYQNGQFSISVKDLKPLDYEDDDWRNFSFMLVAKEVANVSHTQSCEIEIKLKNLYDEYPKFTNDMNVSLYENITMGDFIIKLIASDRDKNDTQTYSCTSSIVQVDPASGVMTAVGQFDHEVQKSVVIPVQVSDLGNNIDYAQVTITILDINDTPPVLSLPTGDASIFENATIGDLVVAEGIKATDPDESALLYFYINWYETTASSQGIEVQREVFENTFRLNPNCECDPGKCTACTHLEKAKNFSWNDMDIINLKIIVRDNETDTGLVENAATLVVKILDVNDHKPEFGDIGNLTIEEESNIGNFIGFAAATDLDGPEYSKITYTLTEIQNTMKGLVRIDENGRLLVAARIDCDCDDCQQSLYYNVTASDIEFSTTISITIEVLDKNDNDPEVTNPIPANKNISENCANGTSILTFEVQDKDKTVEYYTPSFMLDKGGTPGVASFFSIDFDSGEITVLLEPGNNLDYEERHSYDIPVIIRDNFKDHDTTNSRSVLTTVTVTLIDENDNPPEFSPKHSSSCLATVKEDLNKDETIKTIKVTDADTTPEYKNITCNIIDITLVDGVKIPPNNLFDINQRPNDEIDISAGITLLDYVGTYSLTIKCENPVLEPNGIAEETYTICITDVNNHVPEILYPPSDGIEILLKDKQNIGSTLMLYNGSQLQSFEAKDEDYGDNGNIHFELVDSDDSSYFKFPTSPDPKKSDLHLKIGFDIEVKRTFPLTFYASDNGDDPKKSPYRTVTIYVLSDGNPPNFKKTEFSANITENAEGVSVIIPKAEDIDDFHKDENQKDQIFYYISEGNEDLHFDLIDKTTNLTVIKPLDYETKKQHTLIIEARNGDNEPAGPHRLNITINVMDVYDSPPQFAFDTYAGGISPGDSPGTLVVELTATDPDENDEVTFEILQDTITANASLNPSTNFFVLSKTGSLSIDFYVTDDMKGYFSFQVQATDRGGLTTTTNVLVFIIYDANRQNFLFLNEKQFVKDRVETIKLVLKKFMDLLWEVEYVTDVDSNKQPTPNRTTAKTHCIDQNTHLPVESYIIYQNVTRIQAQLREEFLIYGLNWNDIRGEKQNTVSSSRLDSQIVLIVVSALLATLVLLLLAAFFFKTRSLNRRLEALSQTQFGSQDSGLNRVNMNVPNTNQHALEGSNPVWNEELTNDDNNSQGSGDSELVGVEDNPEFRPQNFTVDSRRGSTNPYFENMGNGWPPDNESNDFNQNNARDPNFSFGPQQPKTPTTEL